MSDERRMMQGTPCPWQKLEGFVCKHKEDHIEVLQGEPETTTCTQHGCMPLPPPPGPGEPAPLDLSPDPQCSNCAHLMRTAWAFCPYCGQAAAWLEEALTPAPFLHASHSEMQALEMQITGVLEGQGLDPCPAIKLAQEATEKAWKIWNRYAERHQQDAGKLEKAEQRIAELKQQLDAIAQAIYQWPEGSRNAYEPQRLAARIAELTAALEEIADESRIGRSLMQCRMARAALAGKEGE